MEACALALGGGVLEVARDADGPLPVQEHLVDGRAREHHAAARHGLGHVVQVGALLLEPLAALQALARALAALHVAAHDVAAQARPLVAQERELVAAAEGALRHLLHAQLFLDQVLVLPHALGVRVAADAVGVTPLAENVPRRAHADGRVHHGGAAHDAGLHDGPERVAHGHGVAPVVHHVAHRAVGRLRVVLRVAPRAGLHDGHLRATARERHRRRSPACAAAHDDDVHVTEHVLPHISESDMSHSDLQVPGSAW